VRSLLLALLLLPTQVTAHELSHPKTLDLHFDPEGVTVEIAFHVQPGPAAAQTRADFDQDGDGALTQSESAALVRRLTTFATFALKLRVNGAEWVGTALEVVSAHGLEQPVRSGSDLGIALRIRYLHAFSNAPTAVELSDRHPDPKWRVSCRVHAQGLRVTPTQISEIPRDRPVVWAVRLD